MLVLKYIKRVISEQFLIWLIIHSKQIREKYFSQINPASSIQMGSLSMPLCILFKIIVAACLEHFINRFQSILELEFNWLVQIFS